MSLWFSETEQDQIRFQCRIENVLFSQQSEFQKVEVVETVAYGRMLIIDDCVMVTDGDEFVYHEMISHIPICLHKNPENVVVIGGGDGGTVRELLKHKQVKKVTLCEIDKVVVDASKQFFPNVSCALDDPRVDVRIGDGIEYVRGLHQEVDLMIIDSTDPIGPGEGLFSGKFYQSVASALKTGGLMVAQSESPWFDEPILARIQQNIRTGFKNVYPYIGSIPTYPRGLWSWTMASQEPIDVQGFDRQRFQAVAPSLSYLNEGLFLGAFCLPPFFRAKLK
jgi:spermidine synthase